jgi:hypothetical protein
MSDKYVIKNCEVIFRNGDFYFCQSSKNLAKNVYCQDCTDCVLKWIVQVCNEYSDKWEDCDFSNGLSDEILKLFDIEECE